MLVKYYDQKTVKGSKGLLVEVVEEDHFTGKGRFTLVFNFKHHVQLAFTNSSQIDQGSEFDLEPYFIAYQYRLVEFQLFDTLVNHHFDIANLGNLLPEIGE